MLDEIDSHKSAGSSCENKKESPRKPILFTASGDAIYSSETTGETQDNQQQAEQSLWQRVSSKSPAFWQAVFTALTFGAIIAYTVYTARQWRTLDTSVSDNRKQFHDILCQMKAQTAAQQDAATAAQGQLVLTQRSLDATVDGFHLDQRAWVGIKVVRMVTLLADQKLRADLMVVNTGKTFALHTMVDATIMSHHGSLDILKYLSDPNRPKMKRPPSIAVLFPNADVTVPGETDGVVNSPTLEAIKAGSEIVYFFGDIHYDDVFRKRHLTRFCYWYSPTNNVFVSMPQNCNYAD